MIKNIPGYEGMYAITDEGKVWSYHTDKYRKSKLDKDGYESISLSKNGKRKSYLIHRLVAITYLANPEDKPHVNHKNGIKNDNRVENLEWCTISENRSHAYKIGLDSNEGERNANSKLTNDEVIAIRVLASKGFTLKQIADIFNIGFTTVSQIKNKKLWKGA